MRALTHWPTAAAAISTVALGVAAFLLVEVFRPETRALTFERALPQGQTIEAVNGTTFPIARGVLTVTEPLAHLRIPLQRTLLGKRLHVQTRFHLDEGEVLEVGMKKSSFWLDYERKPLQHRLLDALLVRDDRTWLALRSDDRIVYVNPVFEHPWKTLEEFEQSPPTDGPIGLYGNAQLPTPNSQLPRPEVRPFRVADDPDSFRAIYAWYPEPDHTDPEWTTNVQVFDLSSASQNNDGSIDLMFFAARAGDGPIRVLLDDLTLRIEPGWPNPRDLVLLARRNLSKLIRRPPAEY